MPNLNLIDALILLVASLGLVIWAFARRRRTHDGNRR